MADNILAVECPKCQEEFTVEVPYPKVRSLIKPIGEIQVYRITSEEIKQFLIQKANYFVKAGVKLELAVKYCEKKKSDPHSGHAALTIAFSDSVLSKRPNAGWFDKMGESDSNMRFVPDIFAGFIRKYEYNRKDLEEILSDYKKLEFLENKYGMTEAFIQDIKMYSTPRLIPTTNKESWIFFSARPEKVIEDMLEDPDTDKVNGGIDISGRVYQINKDVVEYIVYVHPQEMKSSENPLVRQLLQGKGKKDR